MGVSHFHIFHIFRTSDGPDIAIVMQGATFYYFGVTFLYQTAFVEQSGFFEITDEIFEKELKSLKEAMYVDTKHLNKYSIGAKTIKETANYDKWKLNGTFMFIENNA